MSKEEILWRYTRLMAETEAGREITDEEAERIGKAIGYSTAPEACVDAVIQVCGYPPDEYEDEDA